MRKILVASTFALCLAGSASAHAMGVEVSLGKGAAISPDTAAQPLNVMVAPGFSFAILRLQLGLVADVPDVKDSEFDIGLRPMLTISPPILPLYGRIVFAVNSLLNDVTVAYGAALGLSFGLGGIGIFAEAGLLPRSVQDTFTWVLEGRLGVSLGF
jgi:hypothetical protein